MFKKMPVVLGGMIMLAICLDEYLPLTVKSILYALSLSIKSLIVFFLPAIVFMLLFKALANLANRATKIIFLILIGVILSNFCAIMMSHLVGRAVYELNLSLVLPPDTVGLSPAWTLVLPKWIPNDYAMFSALLCGLFGASFFPVQSQQVSLIFDRLIHLILRMILRLIPLFVVGFVVKLMHDRMLQNIAHDYALIFAVVAIAQFSYISFLYLLINRFQIRKWLGCLKNMLPAALGGFSSMSSAATMPLTLVAAEKNTQNPGLARFVIPATVNTHLIGSCFAITILTFAVMRNFGVAAPSVAEFMFFSLYFVISLFSVAAIPGGVILVMLPILESYFGFTSPMSALISALYILLDPMITCSNVLGNGAFALAMNRLLGHLIDEKPAVEIIGLNRP